MQATYDSITRLRIISDQIYYDSPCEQVTEAMKIKAKLYIENYEDDTCIEIKDGSFFYHMGPIKEFLASYYGYMTQIECDSSWLGEFG